MAEDVVDQAFASFEHTGFTFTIRISYLNLALIEYRKVPADVLKMLRLVDEAEHSFAEWEIMHGLGGCKLIYGIVARLIGNPDQALELFEEGYALTLDARYDWGIASSRYFAAKTLRDITESEPDRFPEASAMMHEAL